MKIQLTELIKTGNISPFKWGDSENDFLKNYPDWKNRITESKNAECPFIEIDSIEFYFDKDFYQGLSEIVIKLWNFDEEYESDFFEISWLKSDLNFMYVKEKINNEKWSYSLTKGARHKTPIIIPNKNTFFSFDPLSEYNLDENKTELQKIYLRKDGYDAQFLNGGKEKITLYNNV